MDDLISIIIPVYNVEKYLRRCVDSVLSQTYKNFECILIDDGSSDSSSKICDEYLKYDNRIKVIHKSNGGLSSARNVGIENSSGEYFCFVDSDDWIDENYIDYLYKSLINSNAQIAASGISIVNEDMQVTNTRIFPDSNLEKDNLFKELVDINGDLYTMVTNKIFDKSLFNDVRFTENRVYEDYIIISALYSKCEKMVTIGQSLYYYYQRNDSLIHKQKKAKNYLDHIYGCLERIRIFEENGYDYYNKRNYITCLNDYQRILFGFSYTEFKNYYPLIKNDMKCVSDVIINLYENNIKSKLYIYIIVNYPKFGKYIFRKRA